jgi:hypothetical protein
MREADAEDGCDGHSEDHPGDAPHGAPQQQAEQHTHWVQLERVPKEHRLKHVASERVCTQREEEGQERAARGEGRVEHDERHGQRDGDRRADVGDEVEPKGEQAEN